MEKQRDKAAKRLERKLMRESGIDPDAEPEADAETAESPDDEKHPQE